MDRIKIALNLRKPGNYAFFCPVSRLHLTRSNPVGYADGVTSAILMGLLSKSLLDVDGVVDLKTGKTVNKTTNNKKESKTETPVKQETVTSPKASETETIKKSETIEAVAKETTEVKSEEEKSEELKKRGKKASK